MVWGRGPLLRGFLGVVCVTDMYAVVLEPVVSTFRVWELSTHWVLALRASDGWAESSDEKRVEEKGAHHVRVVSAKCVVSRRVNDRRVEGGLGGARNVCVVRV